MTNDIIRNLATGSSSETLPGRLSSLGITPPKALTDAVKRSQWKILPSPAGEMDALKDRLYNAKTEDEWLAAQAETVALVARINAYEETAGAIRSVASMRFPNALDECLAEIIDGLCAKYNEYSPAFVEAAALLPNLHNRQATVFELTPEETAALHASKKNADAMNAVLKVYDDVLKLKRIEISSPLLGDKHAREAARIGRYDEWSQIREAAGTISLYTMRAPGMTLAPLAPHIAVTLAGGSLELKRPSEAVRMVEDLAEAAPAEPRTSLPIADAVGGSPDASQPMYG